MWREPNPSTPKNSISDHKWTHLNLFSSVMAVGKTTFLTCHLTGEFTKRYIPTLGADVHSLDFSRTGSMYGTYRPRKTYTKLRIVRSWKSPKVGRESPQYQTNRVVWEHGWYWWTQVRSEVHTISQLYRGEFGKKNVVGYYDISAKSNYNFWKVVIYNTHIYIYIWLLLSDLRYGTRLWLYHIRSPSQILHFPSIINNELFIIRPFLKKDNKNWYQWRVQVISLLH